MHKFLETTFAEIIAQVLSRIARAGRGFEIFGPLFELIFTSLVFFQSTEVDLDALDVF